MTDLNVAEMLTKCRVCLSAQDDLMPIFQELQIFQKTLKLDVVLREIGDVELTASDELPKKICYGCVLELTAAQAFRDKCKKSDRLCKEILWKVTGSHTIFLCENSQDDMYSIRNEIGLNKTDTFIEEKKPYDDTTAQLEEYLEIKMDDLSDSFDSDGGELDCDSSTTGTELVCDVCFETFRSHETLNRHKERCQVSSKEKIPGCKVCGKNFFAKEMIEHMRSHTGERPFQCFYCKKQYVSKRKVVAHQRFVCKEVEVYFEDNDDETEMTFDDGAGGKDVMVTEEADGLFVCRITKRELMRAGRYQCEICKKKFPSELQLNRHRPMHNEKKPERVPVVKTTRRVRQPVETSTVCEICGKQLGTVKGLLYHKESHDEFPKNVKCSLCEKTFFSSAGVLQHKRIFHKDSTCDICCAEFSTPRQRAHHKLREHSSVTTTFKCIHCDETFIDKYLRHRHYRSKHAKIKIHRCPICNVEKSSMSKVTRHMVVHTGDKPYSCDLCNRKFGHENNLTAHNRKFHGAQKKTDD